MGASAVPGRGDASVTGRPERVVGRPPQGGAYSVAYRDAGGRVVEVVEFDADDRQISRTYTEPAPRGCARSAAGRL